MNSIHLMMHLIQAVKCMQIWRFGYPFRQGACFGINLDDTTDLLRSNLLYYFLKCFISDILDKQIYVFFGSEQSTLSY